MQFNHYKPVSLLCILSKVFEKVMYSRLISFLNTFSILYENQFGFLKSHSTHMALLTLMDKLVHAIENGEYSNSKKKSKTFYCHSKHIHNSYIKVRK